MNNLNSMKNNKHELDSQLLKALQEKKRDFQAIEVLLNAGANPNLLVNSSETLLMWEVWKRGSLKVIQLLLAAKANVNAKDSSGLSALALATIKNRLELVQIIVGAGAEINTVDDEGYSVLDLAYQHNHPHIVRFLESRGAKSGFEIKEQQIGVKAKKMVLHRQR